MSGLEIISKGSFEMMADNVDDRPPSSRSSTSLGIRADGSHLSLEYLTPEEPHYGGSQHQLALEPSPGVEESKRPGDGLDSSAPHSRTAIQELSEKIRTLKMELVELEDGEPLNSGLELLEGDDDDEDRTLVTASSSDDCSTALVTAEGLGTTEARGNQYSHAETAGGEKTEDGASFSDLERVAADGDGISPTQGPSSSHGSHSGVGVGESQRSGWDRLQADPKLQRAIEKMKKLDTKLDDVVKKEKEVKRQRKLLEQQMENGSTPSNSRALVSLETGENTPPTSPVFHTQLDENCSNAGDHPSGSARQDVLNEEQGPHAHGQETEAEGTKPNPRLSQERHGGVDYIKRNIELASEAGASLAMTEAERKRLEQLLEDDELEDPYASPAALPGIPGVTSGFQYSDHEEERMRDIDSQLQALMPAEDWQSMCSSRMTTPATLTQALPDESNSTTSVPDISSAAEIIETGKHIGPGEEVLQQFQVSREESQKLREIEEQLSAIWEEKAREAETLPALPAPQLQALVEQCKRELSQQNPTREGHSCSQPGDGTEPS